MALEKKQILSWLTKLIGSKSDFSLEARIFHAVIFFAMLAATANTVINFSLGLFLYGLLMMLMMCVLGLGYYLSRYKGKLNLAVGIFAIAFNLLCGATYFAVEGSQGVNLFTFVLIVFLLSVLSSRKQFFIWIPFTVLLVLALFFLEYYYPDLVKPLYPSKRHKLIDIAQTWVEVAVMIAIITLYIRENYLAEKALAKSRLIALEELNATKNKLFSIIAHDLRAPLASVENYLAILNQVDLLPEEKKTMEQNLLASTRQTSEMLQNMLNWSKDQMMGITANLSQVDLLQSLLPTITHQQILAREKDITLKYSIAPDIGVIADENMLQLIIRNLLNNAIKFSLSGGTIELTGSRKDTTCIIEVKDSGVGIEENKETDIFSLKNTGSAGTHREKGVGLGLLLAKTYIELQHGEIWYTSKPGMGTSFFISLPLQH